MTFTPWFGNAPGVIDEPAIATRYGAVSATLDERSRRLLLGAEALAAGPGGQAAVARATGASPATVRRGLAELAAPVETLERGRIRRPGGGRKRTVELEPNLRADLEALIEPGTRGDPESPLRWTTRSVRNLAAELERQGHRVSHRIVGELLHELGYSLQANSQRGQGAATGGRTQLYGCVNYAGTKSRYAFLLSHSSYQHDDRIGLRDNKHGRSGSDARSARRRLRPARGAALVVRLPARPRFRRRPRT